MNELPHEYDDIAQRLRAHYDRTAQPPPSAQLWQSVADELRTEQRGTLFMEQQTRSPQTPQAATYRGQPTTRRATSFVTGTASLAAVVLIALLAHGIFANRPGSASTNPGNHPQSTPGAHVGNEIQNAKVSMDSAEDGWAVGTQCQWPCGQAIHPFFSHFTGGAWQAVTVTGLTDGIGLHDVHMVTANDGWAVGYDANAPAQSLVLHYDGTSWSRVAADAIGGLNTLAMVSATEGWAITDSSNKRILHYHHAQWKAETLPAAISWAESIDILSATDGWLGATSLDGGQGTGNVTAGMFLRLINGQWRVQQTFPKAQITSLSMSSATDGWATGEIDTVVNHNVTSKIAFWHYTEGRWVQLPDQTGGGLADGAIATLKMLSPTDGWLLSVKGLEHIGSPIAVPTVIYHYNGVTWERATSPTIPNRIADDLSGVSFVTPDEAWAVGSANVQEGAGSSCGCTSSGRLLIMHYLNGTWTVVQS